MVENIRPFQYRSRRIFTGFPVEFACLGQITRGTCLNVSDDGLRAEMESEIEQGASGLLTLRPSGKHLQVAVQTVNADSNQAGFAFCFQSDSEREQVAALIASLAPAKKTGRILIGDPRSRQ